MSRLKALPLPVSVLSNRVASVGDDVSRLNRDDLTPWRKWYKTKQWYELRKRIFLRDRFTCQEPDCRKLEFDSSLLVAHHVKAHKGSPKLFWDESNIRTACKPCHDGIIQSRERIAQMKGK